METAGRTGIGPSRPEIAFSYVLLEGIQERFVEAASLSLSLGKEQGEASAWPWVSPLPQRMFEALATKKRKQTMIFP